MDILAVIQTLALEEEEEEDAVFVSNPLFTNRDAVSG